MSALHCPVHLISGAPRFLVWSAAIFAGEHSVSTIAKSQADFTQSPGRPPSGQSPLAVQLIRVGANRHPETARGSGGSRFEAEIENHQKGRITTVSFSRDGRFWGLISQRPQRN